MDTEQLVRQALRAKAEEISPEQVDVRYPDLTRAGRPSVARWALVAATAAAVAALLVASWVAAPSSTGGGAQVAAAGTNSTAATTPPAPPPTTTPPAAPATVAAPFPAPWGWSMVTTRSAGAYTSWCVTRAGTGTDNPCSGAMVYLASGSARVPVDDALVPACNAVTTNRKLVTPATIDGRTASLVTQQCTQTDPTWLIWRTTDGVFAAVAQKGSDAAHLIAGSLADVRLPGPSPASTPAAVSTIQPEPSTSTCPPAPRQPPPVIASLPSAAGTTQPIPTTEHAAADDGCPTY